MVFTSIYNTVLLNLVLNFLNIHINPRNNEHSVWEPFAKLGSQIHADRSHFDVHYFNVKLLNLNLIEWY